VSAKLQFGLGGMFMPPAELNARACQSYEERGLDFVAWWDQMCMTFPRSIWTPDVVPTASVYDTVGGEPLRDRMSDS